MKPNILFITTDQQHWKMMSCAGETSIVTPNCDRLAAEGLRFNRCYTTNPLCVPARYSFLTGHMPHVFDGMEHNFKTRPGGAPIINDWIDTPILGHQMRAAGYETAYGGKLHVEGPYGLTEEKAEAFGFRFIDSDIFEKNAHSCAAFIKEQHDKPFFLWASFDQPHDICKFLHKRDDMPGIDVDPGLPANHAPTQGESEWMRHFRLGTLGDEDSYELGLNRHFAQAASTWDEKEWKAYRSALRAFMLDTDRYIGHLISALEESGQLDNTIIILTSDHGDSDGAHQLTMKRSFYEESAHVPLLIRLPDQKHAGRVDETHMISNGLDLYPTFCELAGIEVPDQLRGQSLCQLWNNKQTIWHEFIVTETHGGRMLCDGQWKYNIYTFDKAEEELYNLHNDPGETVNLAGDTSYKETLLIYREKLRQWVADFEDVKGRGYCKLLDQQLSNI